MQFPAGVFLIHHQYWKRLLICTILAITTRLRKKHRYFWYPSSHQWRWKRRPDRLLQERGIWSSRNYLACDSFSFAPWSSHWSSPFSKCSFLCCQSGSLWGVPKAEFKDLILKSFCQLISRINLTCLKANQRHTLLSLTARLRIFLGMGAFLFSSIDGHAEGKAVFIWMSSSSLLGPDLSWEWLLPYTGQMRLIPSLVQDDKKAYLKADLLEKLLQRAFKLWSATTRKNSWKDFKWKKQSFWKPLLKPDGATDSVQKGLEAISR